MKVVSMLLLLLILITIFFILGFLIIYIPYRRSKKEIKQHGFKTPVEYTPHSSVNLIEQQKGSSLDGFKAVDNFNKE